MTGSKPILKLIVVLCSFLFLTFFRLNSQQAHQRKNILFYQLTTVQGLSDSYIGEMCFDKNGNLWIPTGDGLNMFNGKKVTRFFKQEYPQLGAEAHMQTLCDDKNRIWVRDFTGAVVIIDENHMFHRVALYKNNKRIISRQVLYTKGQGLMLLTEDGILAYRPSKKINADDSVTINSFLKLEIPGLDTLPPDETLPLIPYDEYSYILPRSYGFYKLDLLKKTLGKKYSFPGLTILTHWAPDEILAYDIIEAKLKSINLVTEIVTYPLDRIKDQFGNKLTAIVRNARKINDDELLLTTIQEGIYIFNTRSKTLSNYKHDAADGTTLINNLPYINWLPNSIACDSSGWVFIGATPNGVTYFNSKAVINQQSVFKDKKGNVYDGYIKTISSRNDGIYYIAGENNFFEWNRNSNTTRFIDLGKEIGSTSLNKEPAGPSFIDKQGRLWASLLFKGVFIYDRNNKFLKFLSNDPSYENSIPPSFIKEIKQQPDGYIWIVTSGGICRVDPFSFKVDRFEHHPLSTIAKLDAYCVFFYDPDNIWIGTYGAGLWHYQQSTGKITNYTKANSALTSNEIFCINKDENGNLYIGESTALIIFLTNGKTKVITAKDGLVRSRVEALMLDKKNRMWMGNDAGLSCFDIKDSSLRIFDEQHGLSVQGFKIGSYHQNAGGEMFWGTEKGLQYFYPDDLYNNKPQLYVSINRMETRNIVTSLTQSNSYRLAANDNYITFHFGATQYLTQLKTYYQYKLEGLDQDWIKVINEDFVRYSSLPAGKYIFKVKVSNDGIRWKDSENEVTLVIASHFYETWWLKGAGLLLSILMIFYVLNYYRKKQKKKQEELEAQVVINYFASQINRHLKTEDILWDVAKNCISKLNFEDCVIYLLDEERNVLVQKAAWGPKLAKDLTINQPIEIPIGEGIVGSVAQSGKPELIGNTELDKRYIADDARRFSELAVPLIIDNKVIGVIDSENSRKNFFTKRHLNILSTVAVLSATQIERAKAEQEELEAQLVINYFASQIHSRYKTDELLWDVAKNLIGKMGFEDCMIYLWNNEKTVLVQKAGYGSKGSMQAIMDKTTYHIPKGKGIVGAAVESKQSLLVNDTSKDKRYFTADETIMLSELCVPLIYDNEVLGAINTEHHKKNFFTPKHQKMLTSIAVLCANQLQHIRAQEEKQQARIEALQNKQKATETRLQSLRLQMNPHFLFNALNSIQQMILANEEMVATKYLSKFSKLLRTILVYSDKEFVTLKEELEILDLYVELESIRFKDSFKYTIECDEAIDSDEIKLPTLLIQPFVENAIWHGLMHKEGNRLLQIKFRETGDCLHCTIEDNGIGRERSGEAKLATGQGKKHTSKGIQVSKERLEAMNNDGPCKGSIEIFDLKDEKGNAAGTRVQIIFPTQNNHHAKSTFN